MVITLIGYRGSGKTTVGQQLASRLGWQFLDADVLIENRAGCTIAEIFTRDGEPGFRRLESQIIGECLLQNELVLATGGGAILDPQSRAAMRLAGPVIWLQAEPQELLQRLEQDATTKDRRPLLAGQNRKSEIEIVLRQRWPLYEETATTIVPTDSRSVTAIVDDIVSRLPTE